MCLSELFVMLPSPYFFCVLHERLIKNTQSWGERKEKYFVGNRWLPGRTEKNREIFVGNCYVIHMVTCEKKKLSCQDVAAVFPPGLLDTLALVHNLLPGEVFMTGGTIRDLLLGRKPADIDLTVERGARDWARLLAEKTGGTYIVLGREEDAARVVWQGLDVDFSSFRDGAASIEQELCKRDITINSMGLPITGILGFADCRSKDFLLVIDPLCGVQDLEEKIIRVTTKKSFPADPLRMLRVFRFSAILDFSVDPDVLHQIRTQKQSLARVSAERIAHELDLIMASPRAYTTFQAMHECGLLWEIFPELRAGAGMEQPSSHHLDVFDHCMEALCQMELVLAAPGRYFPENADDFKAYLTAEGRTRLLKWAALFHDVGKPVTYGINEDKGGRITFYNHDLEGAALFAALAARLRWSKDDSRFVERLIAGHMRPFFLANNQRQGELTVKACLRLIRHVATHLPGLFLLAMADALAGKGENSPEEIEKEVAGLFTRLREFEKSHVNPVRTSPPLLTGKDLIRELQLAPGPLFGEILARVEEARMEQRLSTREEALTLAAECVRQNLH